MIGGLGNDKVWVYDRKFAFVSSKQELEMATAMLVALFRTGRWGRRTKIKKDNDWNQCLVSFSIVIKITLLMVSELYQLFNNPLQFYICFDKNCHKTDCRDCWSSGLVLALHGRSRYASKLFLWLRIRVVESKKKIKWEDFRIDPCRINIIKTDFLNNYTAHCVWIMWMYCV